MPKLEFYISETTLQRLKDYARDEWGGLPEEVVTEIVEEYFAEPQELDSDGTLAEHLDWVRSFAEMEMAWGKSPGTARKYKSRHPEMIESGEFVQLDGRTWGMSERTARKIWGNDSSTP